jgi:hypothetical protein
MLKKFRWAYSRQYPSHLLKILKFPFQKCLNPLDSIPQIRSRPISFIGFPDLIVVEQHLAFPGKQPIGVVGVIWGFQILHCLFCIVAEVENLDILNQSIHYQVYKIKNCVLGGLAFLFYLHHMDAKSTRISVLAATLKQTLQKLKAPD